MVVVYSPGQTQPASVFFFINCFVSLSIIRKFLQGSGGDADFFVSEGAFWEPGDRLSHSALPLF